MQKQKYNKTDMWNLQSCNKIIQQRTQQKNYEIHRQKLKSMQPRMRIQQPIQPDFIYTKNKLNMSRRDRRIQIDRLNQILLTKMQCIRLEEYNANKLRSEAQNLKTMNAHMMEQMNQKIAKENKRFCQKLMKTQSYYPTMGFLQKADHLQYVASNISYNARRCMSARSLKTRPKSSYTTAFSSAQKKKSTEFFRPVSGVQRKRVQSARPGTARMYNRSSQKRILVTQSGRPRIQGQQNQEYL